jgi:nickel/cobalt transporter (NiCoT) family protein
MFGLMTTHVRADPAPAGSALARFRESLTRKDWAVIGAMAGFVVLLHVVGWGVLAGWG